MVAVVVVLVVALVVAQVGKAELRDAVEADPELAARLGLHLTSGDGSREAELTDEYFDAFWKHHYHGYKATATDAGGLSAKDFVAIVKKDRLSRAAALHLFRAIDTDNSGYHHRCCAAAPGRGPACLCCS